MKGVIISTQVFVIMTAKGGMTHGKILLVEDEARIRKGSCS